MAAEREMGIHPGGLAALPSDPIPSWDARAWEIHDDG